jgi:hypothetical protein
LCTKNRIQMLDPAARLADGFHKTVERVRLPSRQSRDLRKPGRLSRRFAGAARGLLCRRDEGGRNARGAA